MVDIFVLRDLEGLVSELTCSGHAGFDDGEGLDLVCAAVSALTGALGLGLTEVLQVECELDAKDGRFHLQIPAHSRREARVLVETVTRALIQMQAHYSGFLTLREDTGDETGSEKRNLEPEGV